MKDLVIAYVELLNVARNVKGLPNLLEVEVVHNIFGVEGVRSETHVVISNLSQIIHSHFICSGGRKELSLNWLCPVQGALQVIDIPLLEYLLEHIVLQVFASRWLLLGLQAAVPELAAKFLVFIIDFLRYAVIIEEGLRIGIGTVKVPVSHTIANDETSQWVVTALGIAVGARGHHLFIPFMNLLSEEGCIDASVALTSDIQWVVYPFREPFIPVT